MREANYHFVKMINYHFVKMITIERALEEGGSKAEREAKRKCKEKDK